MNIVDARGRLPLQARSVEVIDVVRLPVEKIEDVDVRTYFLRDGVAHTRVHERSRARAHAVVLDERTWPEVAPAQRPEPAMEVVDVRAGGDDGLRRTWNAIAC